MLILSRREGDILEITIPELDQTFSITVTEIKGGQVKLGFESPRHWNIRRKELDGIRRSPNTRQK